MATVLEKLPDLSSAYTQSPEQIASYRQNGFVLLRGVCTPQEVTVYRAVFRDLIQKHYPEPPKMEERDVFTKAFLSLTNNWVYDEIVRPFVFSPRFAKLAADVMKELTPTRQSDLEHCAPGVEAGELVVGARNLLLYHKEEC